MASDDLDTGAIEEAPEASGEQRDSWLDDGIADEPDDDVLHADEEDQA